MANKEIKESLVDLEDRLRAITVQCEEVDRRLEGYRCTGDRKLELEDLTPRVGELWEWPNLLFLSRNELREGQPMGS